MDNQIESLLRTLECEAKKNDQDSVQECIFDLGGGSLGYKEVPCKIFDFLIEIAVEPDIAKSRVSGHILNFFEFESSRLSNKQKLELIDCLEKNKELFSDIHGAQVVSEILSGRYFPLPLRGV